MIGSLLRTHRKAVAASFAALLVGVLVTLWWNMQMSGIINTIAGKSMLSLRQLAFGIAAIFASCLTNCLKIYSSLYVCQSIAHGVRSRIARYIVSRSALEIAEIGAGDALSALQNEAGEVAQFLQSNLYTLAADIMNFAGSFIWLLFLDTKLSMIAFAPLLPIMGYTFYSSRKISVSAEESQQANAVSGGQVETLVAAFPIIRVFEAGKLILTRFEDSIARWEKANIREERLRARLLSLSAVISFLPLILIFLFGGGRVIRGGLSLGTLYVFIQLSGHVSAVFMNMPGRLAGFRRFAVNLKRLKRFDA